MKRDFLRLLAASCILLAAACGKEKDVNVPGGDDGTMTVTLNVSFEDLTKAHAGTPSGGKLPFEWQESDVIAVYDGYKIREFHVIPGSVNGNSAAFTGELWSAASSLVAMYPYSSVSSYKSGAFVYSVPAVQTADASGSDPAALVAEARASVGEKLVFANKTALVGVPVSSGTSRITIHTHNGETFTAGSESVAIKPGGTESICYIAVRPGTLNGLSVFVTMSDGRSYMVDSANAMTFNAGKVRMLSDVPMPKDNPVTVIYDEATLKSFLASSKADTKGKVFVVNDIDVTGNVGSASGFSGEFDGLGHKIDGMQSSHPLFMTNSGVIRSLTLASGCSFTPADNVFGAFVGENSGTLEALVNKAPVTLSASSLQNPLVAGVVGKSTGRLLNCENEGAIKVNSSSFVTAAGVAGIAGYLSAAAEGCVNKGPVSLDALYIKEKGTIVNVTGALPCVGGIAAYGAPGFTLNGCDNYGAVHFGLSAAETDLTASLERTQIGGVVGGPCGDVKKCCNYAVVDVNVHSSTVGTALPKGLIVQIGGIGGGDYNFTSSSGTAINTGYSDCVNKGDISFYTDASASNSVVGGIVGWPGQEAVHDKATENCANYGNITINGAGKIRAGGIQGGTGAMRNCQNYGKIEAGNVGSTSVMGGICGFHSRGHAIENCENYGDVIANVRIDGAGGLIGNQGNAAMTSGAGCKVKCTVQNDAADRTGMVVGYFNGTSNAITLGSQTSPIGVEGSIVMGSAGVAITKYNVETYKCGSANPSNHTVYVTYTGPDTPPAGDFADGYIKYTDGTPAAGVSVSDGFRVAVTNAEGYYSLETCKDTWYIYFSYPSNAVIKKNATGTPDFYKRYVQGVSRYDFTLEKCAVENEFALFAMADPQAHYAARGTQKTADTQRFLNESVPAVNSQIAASTIPCYGVTLGDIVYSEGNRNSNAGMNTMAGHFGKINMPVFQTMGNHDYTYFNASSPLTTDATSSTLNLKAQRVFENAFGPINHSFNRGNVHVVCMKDIIYDSTTDASKYHGGFLDDQYEWLRQDLANVPKSMKVILCVHIPIVSSKDGDNVANVMNLLKQFTDSEVFSGHTHYYRYSSSTASSGLKEHIHSAVCGQWWWSKIEGDGCPNGYTIYNIKGTSVKDAFFIGVNDRMNTRDYQMRLYRGNLLTGGKYAYFQSPFSYNDLMINVFSGDSRWSVKVYVNGVYAGTASLMSASSKSSWNSVSPGQTYTPSTKSSQDWWAIAYHIGVCNRGTASTSYYTTNYHMFRYTLGSGVSASDKISVEATDPYGNVYTCSEIVEDGLNYPEYIKIPLNL